MTEPAGDLVPQPAVPTAGELWAYRARGQDPLVQVAVVRLGVKKPQRVLDNLGHRAVVDGRRRSRADQSGEILQRGPRASRSPRRDRIARADADCLRATDSVPLS
jgi:hypothetical protein